MQVAPSHSPAESGFMVSHCAWSKGPVSDTALEPFRPSPAFLPFLPALSWGSTATADFQFFQRVSPGPLLPTPAQPAA